MEKGLKFWIRNNIDSKIHALFPNGECEITETGAMKPLIDSKAEHELCALLDEWLQLIGCDVVMDIPICYYWEVFHRYYPDAKVAISIRDFDAIFDSMARLFYGFFNSLLYRVMSYFFNWLYWTKYTYLYQFFLRQGGHVIDKTAQKWTLDRQSYIADLKRRLKRMKTIMKGEELIFNFKKGWPPLCSFLNVAIPTNHEYPWMNGGKITPFMHFVPLFKAYAMHILVFSLQSCFLLFI